MLVLLEQSALGEWPATHAMDERSGDVGGLAIELGPLPHDHGGAVRAAVVTSPAVYASAHRCTTSRALIES